jgi:hypothetical protein
VIGRRLSRGRDQLGLLRAGATRVPPQLPGEPTSRRAARPALCPLFLVGGWHAPAPPLFYTRSCAGK